MRIPLILTLALLAGCNRIMPIGADNGDAGAGDNATALDPGTRAVTIGEGGPGSDACFARGTVVRLAPGDRVPLRVAPFDNAAEAGAVQPGARLYVCTRTIDQRWLGVVAIPAPVDAPPGNDTAPADHCGLDRAVEGARDYAGPCMSGWISASLVRMSAG